MKNIRITTDRTIDFHADPPGNSKYMKSLTLRALRL